MEVGGVLTYEGSSYFRQRLILATLSGKSVRIRNIRTKTDHPGLRDYEVSFIRLLDCLNNGSCIEVNETGTAILYRPGILAGGVLEHTCPLSRSIGYFLEPLLMLAPFCKNPLSITLYGITNNEVDPSFDMISASLVPVLQRFVGKDELTVKCVRRGMSPGGGGKVIFTCPIKRNLTAFQWLECGQIKRIRGVAYTSRVTPTAANRMLDAAKGVFLNYLTDVYFTVDNAKGVSPGLGLCVVAESNKGTILCGEAMSCQSEKEKMTADSPFDTPEEIGQEAAYRLLEEIWRGGCVDAIAQPLLLIFMALTPTDVSKAVLGPLTPYSMNFLSNLRDFFHVTFKINEHNDEAGEEDNSLSQRRTGAPRLLLTCVGVGYTNIGKGQT